MIKYIGLVLSILLVLFLESRLLGDRADIEDSLVRYTGIVKKIECDYNSLKNRSNYKIFSGNGEMRFFIARKKCISLNAEHQVFDSYFEGGMPAMVIVGGTTLMSYSEGRGELNFTINFFKFIFACLALFCFGRLLIVKYQNLDNINVNKKDQSH